MFPALRSLCRLASIPVRRMAAVRMFSIEPGRVGQNDSEPLSDMISSGTHKSTESITRFMNSVYVNKPRAVSLFSFNYRQEAERSTIRGICIGNNSRKAQPTKKITIVSGLPLQDPSLIGVGLYIAAVLSRLPTLPHDVAIIPLAHPKEYESRWRVPRSSSKREVMSILPEQDPNWLAHENVTLEIKDSCKPIETYITRKHQYIVNVDVNLNTYGSSMQYKGNSLADLAAKSKHRTFLSDTSPRAIPLPSSLSTLSPSSTLILEEPNPLIASYLETPSLVLELKGTQPLDDEQVVARGEEVIKMVKEMFIDK